MVGVIVIGVGGDDEPRLTSDQGSNEGGDLVRGDTSVDQAEPGDGTRSAGQGAKGRGLLTAAMLPLLLDAPLHTSSLGGPPSVETASRCTS